MTHSIPLVPIVYYIPLVPFSQLLNPPCQNNLAPSCRHITCLLFSFPRISRILFYPTSASIAPFSCHPTPRAVNSPCSVSRDGSSASFGDQRRSYTERYLAVLFTVAASRLWNVATSDVTQTRDAT